MKKKKRMQGKGARKELKRRQHFSAEQVAWLETTQGQISGGLNATSWVEKIAEKRAKRIVIDCGLGNSLRAFHPFAAHVRDVIGRTPGGNRYGREGGMPQVIEAGLNLYKELDSVQLGSEHAVVNEKGSCELLGYLAEAMSEKDRPFVNKKTGDLQVLLVEPGYGRHFSVLPKRDVRHHYFDPFKNIGEGDDAKEKTAKFSRALKEAVEKFEAKLVVLSSGYNPTAIAMLKDQLIAAASICKDAGAVLYIDGAYRHLYRESNGPIPSIFKAVKDGLDLQIVESLSVSKGHQSPGNGGMLLGNADLIEMVRLVRKRKAEGGSVALQLGMAAMLRDLKYLEVTRRMYDDYFAYLVKTWKQAGWAFDISDCTIFIKAFLPEAFRDAGWNAEAFARLLATQGIIVYPKGHFLGNIEGEWLRICANGKRQNVDEAAEVIHRLTKEPPPLEGTWPE